MIPAELFRLTVEAGRLAADIQQKGFKVEDKGGNLGPVGFGDRAKVSALVFDLKSLLLNVGRQASGLDRQTKELRGNHARAPYPGRPKVSRKSMGSQNLTNCVIISLRGFG